MSRLSYIRDGVAIGILTIAIPCAIFAVSLADVGERNLGVIENIHGIPYPERNGSILITEEMAHADLFLRESVFAKDVKVVVAFDPGNATSLDLGVRENEFWLSYRKYPLYRQGMDAPGFQTKEIAIPLTDVLQDTDQSVDLMFFADNTQGSVEWRIHAFHASLFTDMPRVAEIKAYIKSILVRERAL
jgi:hypothetical protein